MSIRPLRQLLSYGTCTLLLVGCTLAPPPSTPGPVEEVRVDPAPTPNAGARWTPRRSAGSWRYRLESNATVTLSRDSASQATQVGRTTLYTITLTQKGLDENSRGSFELTGRVDSIALSTNDRVPRHSTGTNAPPHFTAELSATGSLTNLKSDAITSCASGTDPITAALQALIVPIPQAVSIGTTWTDTISTVTCRGRAAIITTAIRHYSITSDTTWQAQPALLIHRTDGLTIESRSDTGGSAELTVHGTGSASATLYVAASTGLLITAASEGSTELTVATSQSSFPFRQDARETITLIP